MLSEIIATILGGLLTYGGSKFINRLQIMKCFLVSDDVQSKITVSIGGEDYNNVYLKEYLLINTTNRDINSFTVIFTFDKSASVIECHSRSKEGTDWQKVSRDTSNAYMAIANITSFNRNDKVSFVFRVGNVTTNQCVITESDCIGFKIVQK